MTSDYNVVIRAAQAADAGRFTELARLAKASWNYAPEWIEAWDDQLTVSSDYLSKHKAVAASIDGLVVGCAVLEDHGDHFMMEHVWIDPSHQRKGIGRALVLHLVALARESGREVRLLSDPNAEAFYEHLGATKLSDVPAPMPGAPERTLPLMMFEA